MRNRQLQLAELILPPQAALSSALQQVVPEAATSQGKRTSNRNRRSPSCYGFDISSSDSVTTAQLKGPRRAGDVENFQPSLASVVETVQTIATQQPDEPNISALIGTVSSPDPRVRLLIKQQTSTLDGDMISMTIFEAENRDIDE